jgi:hypothetical protein
VGACADRVSAPVYAGNPAPATARHHSAIGSTHRAPTGRHARRALDCDPAAAYTARMSETAVRAGALVCHPSTPAGPVRGIAVDARRDMDGTLVCTYRLTGDMGRIRVPAPAPPRFTMQLWEHTCFEAFIGRDGESGYHEFNLAPSRAWAVFGFRRYREVESLGDETVKPAITTRSSADGVQLRAVLPVDELSPEHRGAALRIGLSAVIEASDGALSYWALYHPPGRADFHHADAFAWRLA